MFFGGLVGLVPLGSPSAAGRGVAVLWIEETQMNDTSYFWATFPEEEIIFALLLTPWALRTLHDNSAGHLWPRWPGEAFNSLGGRRLVSGLKMTPNLTRKRNP